MVHPRRNIAFPRKSSNTILSNALSTWQVERCGLPRKWMAQPNDDEMHLLVLIPAITAFTAPSDIQRHRSPDTTHSPGPVARARGVCTKLCTVVAFTGLDSLFIHHQRPYQRAVRHLHKRLSAFTFHKPDHVCDQPNPTALAQVGYASQYPTLSI